MKKDVKILLLISILVFCFAFYGKAEAGDNISYLQIQFFGESCVITGCDASVSGELVIPEKISGKTVTAVTDKAFYKCKGLTKIVLPDTVTSIGKEAFAACTQLVEAETGNGATSLGKAVFSQCYKLEKAKLSDNITSIPENMFYLCEKLCVVNIPLNAAFIGENAFFGCESIKTILLSEAIKSISVRAFSNCNRLESIYIPASVESIGADAFERCTALNAVYYSGDESTFSKIDISTGNDYLLNSTFNYSHRHSAQSTTVISQPGCTFEGYCDWSCRCGYRQNNVVIPARGHIMSDAETIKEPDCKNSGISRTSCTECDYYEEAFIPAYGHNVIADIAVKETCTKSGKTKGSHCTVCGEVISAQKLILPTGHSFTIKIKDKKHLASKATYLKAEKYYYTCSGCGKISSNKTFTGEKLALDKVKSVDFSSESKTVTLKWSKVPYARGYAVFTKASDGKWKLYKRVLKNTINITGLSQGNIYEIGIKAYVLEGDSIVYASELKTVKVATNPPAPSKIICARNQKSITLKWDKIKNATGYRVYRYDSKKGKWITIKSDVKTNKVTLSKLESGRRYKLSVRAVIDTDDNLVFSKRSKSVTACTKPGSPAVKATSYKYSVKLRWDMVKYADGYAVYVATEPNGTYKKLGTTRKNIFIAENLKSDKYYYFKVHSYRVVTDENVYSYKTVKKVKTR